MKEYYEEQTGGTGGGQRKKVGPAYLGTPEEFREELERIHPAITQAANYFFAAHFVKAGPKDGKFYADKVLADVEKDLYEERHPDPTLAIAVCEGDLAELEQQEAAARRTVNGESEMVEENETARALQELELLREQKEEAERLSAFFFSIHPSLRKLYQKGDLADWARQAKTNVEQRVSRLRREARESGSNVQLGEASSELESIDRFLEHHAVAADYKVIERYLEARRAEMRRELVRLISHYALSIESQKAHEREKIFHAEEILFQLNQMRGMLEEERHLARLQQVKG